jgi:16S rRNA U516 pseudouridylate synthase RsuA-like enzyme
MKIRLHKAIADAGAASRRAAEKMISQGRVTVNGELITTMGVLVDPDVDLIAVDGEPLAQPGKKRTYLVYKPKGVLCTRDDPEGRRTIYDILPEELQQGLHSAGRLDYSAEGLRGSYPAPDPSEQALAQNLHGESQGKNRRGRHEKAQDWCRTG